MQFIHPNHCSVFNNQTMHFWTLAPILKHNVSLLPSQEICQFHYITPCNYFPHSSFISIQMQRTIKHIKYTNIITLLPHTHQNSLQNFKNISPNIAYMNPFYLTFQHVKMVVMMIQQGLTISLILCRTVDTSRIFLLSQ